MFSHGLCSYACGGKRSWLISNYINTVTLSFAGLCGGWIREISPAPLLRINLMDLKSLHKIYFGANGISCQVRKETLTSKMRKQQLFIKISPIIGIRLALVGHDLPKNDQESGSVHIL